MKKEFRWILLVAGIFAIIAGLYMVFQPAASLASLTLILGLIMLFSGISEIFQFLFNKERRSGFLLFNGILTLIFAGCILSSTALEIVTFIPYFIAFWVLFTGGTRIFVSFAEKKIDKNLGKSSFWMGVLGVAVGLFLIGHPIITGLMAAYLIGFGFIYQGAMSVAAFFRLGKEA